jgi:hypothetical protein
VIKNTLSIECPDSYGFSTLAKANSRDEATSGRIEIIHVVPQRNLLLGYVP